MPKEFGRNQRVAQFIKKELAVLIQREFPLNEFGMITLSNVDLSPDLKNAIVYVTTLNNKLPNDQLVSDLNEKAGHYRQEISRLMTSKGVPSFRFKYDESVERAQRLSDIIESVNQKDDS